MVMAMVIVSVQTFYLATLSATPHPPVATPAKAMPSDGAQPDPGGIQDGSRWLSPHRGRHHRSRP